MGFSQNPWADRLLSQAEQDLEYFPSAESYRLRQGDPFLDLFKGDRALASIATEDFLSSVLNQMSGSSFLGYINRTRVLAHFCNAEQSNLRLSIGHTLCERLCYPVLE